MESQQRENWRLAAEPLQGLQQPERACVCVHERLTTTEHVGRLHVCVGEGLHNSASVPSRLVQRGIDCAASTSFPGPVSLGRQQPLHSSPLCLQACIAITFNKHPPPNFNYFEMLKPQGCSVEDFHKYPYLCLVCLTGFKNDESGRIDMLL